MKRFNITVNGKAYDVAVEELDSSAAPVASASVSAPVQAAAPGGFCSCCRIRRKG